MSIFRQSGKTEKVEFSSNILDTAVDQGVWGNAFRNYANNSMQSILCTEQQRSELLDWVRGAITACSYANRISDPERIYNKLCEELDRRLAAFMPR